MFKQLKSLFSDLAHLRRYREERMQRLPLSIRFSIERKRLRKAAHEQWSGGYIDCDDLGYLYVPAEVDLMAARRLLKPMSDANFLRHWLPKCGTVIDVGANIGDWSLPAVRAVGPEGLVLAVEPIPRMAKALRKTFDINRLNNAKVIEMALSDSSGTATFAIERGNSGGSRLGGHPLGHDDIQVNVMMLDELVEHESLKRVDFIKIDVEGHEARVLAGAKKTLARWKPLLILETGQESLEGRHQIADCLQRIGYQIAGFQVDGGILEFDWDEYLNGNGRCAGSGIENLVFY